jgi:predicted helicase
LTDQNIFRRGGGTVFPLYLYPEHAGCRFERLNAIVAAQRSSQTKSGILGWQEAERVAELIKDLYTKEEYDRWPNFSPLFLDDIRTRLSLQYLPDGQGDLETTFGPEDVFSYLYAILHSPTYRRRYAEFLKIDFPHVPLTADLSLFRTLAAFGTRLVDLHLMCTPDLARASVGFPVPGSDKVERIIYSEADRAVFINPTQRFTNVPPEAWEYQVGGYQVAEKWLKDRKTRALTYEELRHYGQLIVVLSETVRLMEEIDDTIPSWPIE